MLILGAYKDIIRGSVLGVPIKRIAIIIWGLYWGPLCSELLPRGVLSGDLLAHMPWHCMDATSFTY